MAKFSKKLGGKEVGDASVYAKPHSVSVASGRPVPSGEKTVSTRVTGAQPVSFPAEPAGVTKNNTKFNKDSNVSVANRRSNDYPETKTSGIKIRGTGCAIKGLMARGPMA